MKLSHIQGSYKTMPYVLGTNKLTSLSDKLELTKQNTDSNNLSDTDPEWRIFIKDHRYHILENSTVIYLTRSDMVRYDNKLKWFIEDKGLDKSMYWIVLEINNIDTEWDFTNIDRIVFPDSENIRSLRKQYRQFRNNLNKAEYFAEQV